jgi:uncharacterized membrane protein YcaP (DUF421 family)
VTDLTDLGALFSFSVSPLEIFVRGTATYWFLFVLFRFVLRRDVGALALTDVLLLVLIADASQNAMAGSYESVLDGFVLVATIAGWSYLLDWLCYHCEPVRKLLEPRPLELIRDGQLLRAHMRRELVTTEELLAALRAQGLEQPSQVQRATMESDGTISVIAKKS